MQIRMAHQEEVIFRQQFASFSTIFHRVFIQGNITVQEVSIFFQMGTDWVHSFYFAPFYQLHAFGVNFWRFFPNRRELRMCIWNLASVSQIFVSTQFDALNDILKGRHRHWPSWSLLIFNEKCIFSQTCNPNFYSLIWRPIDLQVYWTYLRKSADHITSLNTSIKYCSILQFIHFVSYGKHAFFAM